MYNWNNTVFSLSGGYLTPFTQTGSRPPFQVKLAVNDQNGLFKIKLIQQEITGSRKRLNYTVRNNN